MRSDAANPWQSLADEPWELEARTALEQLAAAVSRAEPREPGLSRGAAGMALFLAYYAEAFDDARAEERAGELLNRACTGLAEESGPGLFSGLVGIAWAVEHLAGAEPGDEDPNDHIDERLASLLAAREWSGVYDLVSGLCGVAVYAIERLPKPAARRCFARVVAHLDHLSERHELGTTWHTPPEHLPPWQREVAPRGYINLGMAHGVPGIVSILASAIETDVATERARVLLAEAVEGLLAQKLASPSAHYPAWLTGGEAPEPARTAWCYGDPGVACALLRAARAAREPAWERAAIEFALDAAGRSPSACSVVDAGLCHGAFGLAHIFLRFYNATGRREFRRAASDWIARGLSLRRPGAGIAGFLTHRHNQPLAPDPSFVEGAAGIGLALLAATSADEPSWDRALLLDLPLAASQEPGE